MLILFRCIILNKQFFFSSSGFGRVSLMSENKTVGTMMFFLGVLWTIIIIVAIILTIRV
jgi:hypothetical protein